MHSRLKRGIHASGSALLRALRFGVFVLLLVVGRLLLPVAGLVTAGGLVLFFFCVLFLRDQMWLVILGGGLAVGGVLLRVFYHAALQFVAPDGTVIVSDP